MHPLVHSLEQGNEERTRATEEEGRQGEKIGGERENVEGPWGRFPWV